MKGSHSLKIVAGLCHVEYVFLLPFRVCLFCLVASFHMYASRTLLQAYCLVLRGQGLGSGPEEGCKINVKACHQAKHTDSEMKKK